ncbi:MAG TPA: RDD family protein [Candidatus Acidoferrales bacterium]|nr:RDD family protein [Candidatus Acidoferrales bacterium]
MIRICSKCGALLLEDASKCCFCDIPDDTDQTARPIRASAAALAEPPESDEPEWHREVARRLGEYRARRQRLHPDELQTGLPFRTVPQIDEGAKFQEKERVRERPRTRPTHRQRQTERVEIRIQPELDFSSAPDNRAHPQTALVPVATLAERRWAGALDAFFLVLSCAGFLVLFHSMGGEIAFAKMDAVVCFTVLFLLYGSYFSLFTTFAGATPGMQFRGLTIVRLDGTLPDIQQLLWRSFGYLLSGATMMLGILWAVWDEDHFSWQDRISQTYITAAVPVDDGSAGFPADPTFAHK